MANPHPIKPALAEAPYHSKDALSSATRAGLIGGAAGFLSAAVQNSLAKQNVGSMGVFTRHGMTIGTYAAAATVYGFSKDAAANLRQKDDIFNTAIGGFLAGATAALRTQRLPRVLGHGAVFSVVLAAFNYTGGQLQGYMKDEREHDEYAHKEALRLNRRRPITETIAEIGEGRGIHPEGYEERRRERLKANLGLDIAPVSADVN
ncbi:NADH-ubiquinone oxidoreductase subunit [Microdochium bolleyi]|uniref:NADH-ubiquinone oxidoreductase subunit n=1 Tax=Microdochium bolleyi TaxID=196109 RepID=A0A136IZK2_9PEZI|nr:NADH-ubiquinone oxidoreductase subunit [Microdochium bolleyi]